MILLNLLTLFQQEKSITSQKFDYHNLGHVANSILNKIKSAISPLFNDPEELPSASAKAKLFAENLTERSNLDDSE